MAPGGLSGPQVRRSIPRGLNGSLGGCPCLGPWSGAYGSHLQLQAHEDHTFDGRTGTRPPDFLHDGTTLSATDIDPKAALRKRGLAAAKSAAAALGDYAPSRVARAFIDRIDLPPHAVIAGYAPLKGEIDSGPLLHELHAMGHDIALPVAELGKPLRFHRWRPGDPLVPGQFGAREPHGGSASLKPQILIVPLVAFDAEGWRLGRGGGFYDRTIAELKAAGPVVTAGIAFSAQRVPQIPREAHDQRLDWIVTEEGAFAARA